MSKHQLKFVLIFYIAIMFAAGILIKMYQNRRFRMKRNPNRNFQITLEMDQDNSNLGQQQSNYQILIEIFNTMDLNRNEYIDLNELSQWIHQNVIDHIKSSIANNYDLFHRIDVAPKNGMVTWTEYQQYFLTERGLDQRFLFNLRRKKVRLKRTLTENLQQSKLAWNKEVKSNSEALTIEEFLRFTHPEVKNGDDLVLLDEIYDKLDVNGDSILSEDEFSSVLMQNSDDVLRQDERRTVFRASVDSNRDGHVDRTELLDYLAPQNRRHSEHRAEALLLLIDTNQDRQLSFDEALLHVNVFTDKRHLMLTHVNDEF